jgi:hypothetical protein
MFDLSEEALRLRYIDMGILGGPLPALFNTSLQSQNHPGATIKTWLTRSIKEKRIRGICYVTNYCTQCGLSGRKTVYT